MIEWRAEACPVLCLGFWGCDGGALGGNLPRVSFEHRKCPTQWFDAFVVLFFTLKKKKLCIYINYSICFI